MPSERIPLLLIEDNPADLRLLTELLEDAAPGRFRIVPASRLVDGLAALRAGTFAVVILDLSLPDADGPDAISAVRLEAPSTPVIVLSGMLNDEVCCTASAHGAAASFVKGEVSIGPLVVAIDELLVDTAAAGQA